MDRTDWAKRPKMERKLAATEFVRGWTEKGEMDEMETTLNIESSSVVDDFALDLPDTPAPSDLTPWIHDAALLADYAGHLGEEKTISDTITRARALRDAARGK